MVARLISIALVLFLAGCMPAVKVIKPTMLVQPVTGFEVSFHSYYQPGTFNAQVDGMDVTSQFAPPGVAGGTAAMAWTQPFVGGTPGPGSPYIGTPQAPGSSLAQYASGPLTHTLRVTGKCIAGTTCAESDEYTFTPINFRALPAPLNIAVNSTVQVSLLPDRSLAGPLVVSIAPRAPAASPHQPAAHIRVNAESPGVPANVTLPAGTGGTTFTIQGTAQGSYFLLLSAPGCQSGSVVGFVN